MPNVPAPRMTRLSRTLRAKPARYVSSLALALALGLSSPVFAQDATPPAALLADSISFDGTTLTARGSVEVLYDGARLTATQITYTRETGALDIKGPLRLTQADGESVILADSAALDSDLRNGILNSARLVLSNRYQLSAARIERAEGRYTRLSKTVTSACDICEGSPVPLWEIRAREVIHDSDEHQIYFTDAQFRLAGVPLLYLPRLRIPDPSLERATGMLTPEFVSSSSLGIGVEAPYFITLGPHRDLTVSPLLTTETNTLKLRYRQEFARGSITANGAITSDSLHDGLRAYAFFDGTWDLGNDLTFGAHLKATSDIGYLVDYDFYGRDRLPSQLTLTRYREGEALDAQIIGLRTLREAEVPIEDTLPFLIGEATYTRDIDTDLVPGRLSFDLSASGHIRESHVDEDGMDVFRFGAALDWQHSHILGAGLKLDAAARTAADLYFVNENSSYDDVTLRLTQQAALRLSYPLIRQGSTRDGGTASEVFTPFVQLGWAYASGNDVPNSDAQLVEFDEGNLFALNRFPGSDGIDTGTSVTLGMNYTRSSAQGSYGITLGRVLTDSISTGFTESSGLAGNTSDWLLGGHLDFDMGLSLATRALFDSNLSITKLETRLALERPRYDIQATHAYVIADADEGRSDPISEVTFDGSVKLAPNWTATGALRHDLSERVTNEARIGVTYQNECVRLGLDVSRRFTETSAIDPETKFSFTVGFGAYDTQNGAAGHCGVSGL